MATDLLKGRRVVVTGGAGALGGAVVEALAAAGAVVEAPARGDVDLTNETQVAAFYAKLPDLWASVHVAGGFAAAPFAETALADFRRQIDMNLTTCFLCCREAVRKMTSTSTSTAGRIINVASRSAVSPAGGSVAYSVSKAGVAALTQALADEVKGRRILVNAVLPSTIDTPANRAAMPDARHDRWPKPSAIAATIVWLASPANELVSGALVPVYGEA